MTVRRCAFTLLEVLLVLALVAAVGAVAWPAAAGLLRAGRLRQGGEMVSSLAEEARTLAVGRNARAALVLLTDEQAPEAFRAWAVLVEEPGEGWRQEGAWRLLPEGVVAEEAGPELVLPVRYHGAAVLAQGQVFLPRGGLQRGDVPARWRLVEGHRHGGRLVRTRPDPRGGSADFFEVTLVANTGQVRVDRP